MELVFRDLSPTDPRLTFGQSGFRTRWNHLLSALGVPLARAPAGFDLAPVLRFRSPATDDIPRFFWRDRWRQASSAERYLQAAAASEVLPALPKVARDRVSYLADASDFLVASFLNAGPAVWPIQLAAARRTLVTSQEL